MTSECWILETALKFRLLPYLDTFDNQFGYKSEHGCLQAISILQSINTKTKDSWVLTLDASAAFDNISHQRLHDQLIKRNVPRSLIIVTMGLLFNTSFYIKWDGQVSKSGIFSGRGTKQGGVVSAILFSATYDDVIYDLNNSNPGVYLNKMKLNNLVYADDICLISSSKFGLRKLYAIVMKFASQYDDLQMNPSKSFILRMGSKRNLQASSFEGIPTCESTRYLGAIACYGCKWKEASSGGRDQPLLSSIIQCHQSKSKTFQRTKVSQLIRKKFNNIGIWHSIWHRIV